MLINDLSTLTYTINMAINMTLIVPFFLTAHIKWYIYVAHSTSFIGVSHNACTICILNERRGDMGSYPWTPSICWWKKPAGCKTQLWRQRWVWPKSSLWTNASVEGTDLEDQSPNREKQQQHWMWLVLPFNQFKYKDLNAAVVLTCNEHYLTNKTVDFCEFRSQTVIWASNHISKKVY